MTRIVSGQARGRRLRVPPDGTRPTSDRAREGLFNTLRSYLDLDGARMLDLFAGSGAIGLEALSRGAAAATFVESSARASAVLRSNLVSTGLSGGVLVNRPVSAYLSSAVGTQALADTGLVFADPPYSLGDAAVADLLGALTAVAPGAIVVIERSARNTPLTWPDPITSIGERRYGEACLWYGRRE